MIKPVVILASITFGLCGLSDAQGQVDSAATNGSLEIRSITVNDKPVPLRHGEANLGPFPERVVISFGGETNSKHAPVRVRYKMNGFDQNWRDGAADMLLTVRFFNAAGDQIAQNGFSVQGESPGWNGSLKTSPLRHRREVVTVPPGASRLWVVVSSAGPPECVGVYVVANLVVSRSSSNAPPTVLLASPFDSELADETNTIPPGWIREGTHSSMARIVSFGQDPPQRAFAILDDDVASHAEWRNTTESAPAVSPGDHILVEWNEMFSIGVGNLALATYPALPQGSYTFNVAGFDIYGHPTGAPASISVLAPPPFWRRTWFWSVVATVVIAIIFGTSRYLAWRGMRQEMARLKNQQALEKERLRIAQDIHDDLGARITEISLASALATKKSSLPEAASAEFDRISRMSRELVSALYETVWAVNPENDNLDALGNYLCQITNRLCEPAGLPCRLQVVDLPPNVQVSSQTRHNITMAVKEAVHNIIKHAHASEMTLRAGLENGDLAICVEDNGGGFNGDDSPSGHGLANMKRRLADIGGRCTVESHAGAGTTVRMFLPLHAKN